MTPSVPKGPAPGVDKTATPDWYNVEGSYQTPGDVVTYQNLRVLAVAIARIEAKVDILMSSSVRGYQKGLSSANLANTAKSQPEKAGNENVTGDDEEEDDEEIPRAKLARISRRKASAKDSSARHLRGHPPEPPGSGGDTGQSRGQARHPCEQRR